MDLIDVLDDPLAVASHLASAALPGAGLIYKWGARLTGKLAKWWKTRGNELIAGIEALQPEQILEKLPTFLGIDLCDGIEAKPDRRPVVLLDTYEALWRNRGQKDGLADRRADAWVRLFIQDAPGALFVIAGRDKLRWSEIDDAWGEVVESRLLGALSDEDADQFLLEVPIVENDVRAKIIDSSQGLPFYLDLQVSHYETLKERGETPSEANFGGTPSDILARFLEHLSDNDQATLRLASYLQIITREAMDELVGAFPTHAINYSFDQMVARSSFVEISLDTYEIHSLLKDELQRLDAAGLNSDFRQIHSQLHEWADAKIRRDPSDEDWLGARQLNLASIESALFHLEYGKPEQLASWIFELRPMLEVLEGWDLLQSCYEVVLRNLDKQNQPNALLGAILQNNLAYAIESQGRLADALEEFRLAEKLIDDSATTDDPTPWYIRWNLSQSLLSSDDLEVAEIMLSGVEEWFARNRPLDSSASAAINGCLSHIKRRQNDILDAELYAIRAVRGHIETGAANNKNVAASIHDLAQTLLLQGRVDEAEPLLRLAVDSFVDSWFLLENATEVGLDPSISAENLDVSNFSFTSEPLFRRALFDPLPRVFEPNSAREFADHRSGFRFNELDQELLRNVLSGDPIKYVEATRHPKEASIVAKLKKGLLRFDKDALLTLFLERAGISFVVFSSEKFDLSYYHDEKLMVVRYPASVLSVELEAVSFFLSVYYVAIRHAGIAPPHPQQGNMALASFEHGANLDAITELASAITALPKIKADSFIRVFSPAMREFIVRYQDGATREELYEEYAEIYETPLNSESPQ